MVGEPLVVPSKLDDVHPGLQVDAGLTNSSTMATPRPVPFASPSWNATRQGPHPWSGAAFVCYRRGAIQAQQTSTGQPCVSSEEERPRSCGQPTVSTSSRTRRSLTTSSHISRRRSGPPHALRQHELGIQI
jgi:hypothetical protein